VGCASSHFTFLFLQVTQPDLDFPFDVRVLIGRCASDTVEEEEGDQVVEADSDILRVLEIVYRPLNCVFPELPAKLKLSLISDRNGCADRSRMLPLSA
jgi:hypothetical protein